MSIDDLAKQEAHRRALLKATAGCGMMTKTSIMATLLNLQATKAAVAQTNTTGYKALVCLFLFGGNDSYNMLAPWDGEGSGNASDPNNTGISGEYGAYYKVRGGVEFEDGPNNTINDGGLAISKDDLAQIADPSGRNFGLHRGMTAEPGHDPFEEQFDTDGNPLPLLPPDLTKGVAGLYNTGKLAFVANVGSLLEFTTKQTYQARSNLPVGLFSHSDLQRHWMSGIPQTRNQLNGWGGRLADLMRSTNSNPAVSMNISLGGANLFQTGDGVFPYTIGTGGATTVSDYNENNLQNRMFKRNVDNLLDGTFSNLLEESFAGTHRNSIDAAISFNSAINNVNIATTFANESPSNQMRTVARVIGAQADLMHGRQVFFVTLGGWDNHTNLLPAQVNNLPRVSRALTSFYQALEELGVANDVVTFTASDFARTLGTNGQGSDHAWGGNHIVMGGGIQGGKIFGQYPTTLELGNPLDLGRGRLIPTTSVDQLAAELAMWFGVSNGPDLVDILPNLREFYGAGETATPLQMFS